MTSIGEAADARGIPKISILCKPFGYLVLTTRNSDAFILVLSDNLSRNTTTRPYSFRPKVLDINIFQGKKAKNLPELEFRQNGPQVKPLFQKHLTVSAMARELQHAPPIGQPRLPPGAQVVTPEPGR
jgi:hypothetical protein